MSVSMPAVLVLIVCKTAIAGPPDVNSEWTKAENRQWATENSMMVCRREEVQMIDPSEGMPSPGLPYGGGSGFDPTKDGGALPQPFNKERCQMAGIRMFAEWDQGHSNSSYRVWRVACPTPVINTITKEIIDWVIPDCGHQDTVICEKDSVI